jgi:hypothetical protein
MVAQQFYVIIFPCLLYAVYEAGSLEIAVLLVSALTFVVVAACAHEAHYKVQAFS